MQELPPKFNEAEIEFLVKLDSELEKVDIFYLDREKEVKERYEASTCLGTRFSCLTHCLRLIELKRQLQELKDHLKCSQVFAPTIRKFWDLTFGQQSKNEERRPPFPLGFITSRPRADSPLTTPDGRFGAVELRRAKKKLREAVLEHHK